MAVVRYIPVIIVFTVFAVCALGWLGTQIRPKPFPPFPEEPLRLRTVPLPNGLPNPVERFYMAAYGNEMPVIEAAVILGRGVLKPFLNIRIPARFVFIHDTGRDYRYYFEATIFGIPFLKANEGYVDGASFFDHPLAGMAEGLHNNQAVNLAVWAEAAWFPAIWATDPHVHWKPVDPNTAILSVPYEEHEECFLVRFNPETGLIDKMKSMHTSDLGRDPEKVTWTARNKHGLITAGISCNPNGSTMRLDQGSRWTCLDAEKCIFNVDVSIYIRQNGY
jgi:hypothetical protein